MSSSYVAMDCCIYCMEPKGILLNISLKESFQNSKVYTSREPCEKCQEQMDGRFTIFEADEEGTHTGNMWIVKPESIAEEFRENCPRNICRVLEEDARKMGLYDI